MGSMGPAPQAGRSGGSGDGSGGRVWRAGGSGGQVGRSLGQPGVSNITCYRNRNSYVDIGTDIDVSYLGLDLDKDWVVELLGYMILG
jgi:hypothetical protein